MIIVLLDIRQAIASLIPQNDVILAQLHNDYASIFNTSFEDSIISLTISLSPT